jgi:hypothetical protein
LSISAFPLLADKGDAFWMRIMIDVLYAWFAANQHSSSVLAIHHSTRISQLSAYTLAGG